MLKAKFSRALTREAASSLEELERGVTDLFLASMKKGAMATRSSKWLKLIAARGDSVEAGFPTSVIGFM